MIGVSKVIRISPATGAFLLPSLLLFSILANQASALTQHELDQSEAKWTQLGWTDYEYGFQRFCFCIGDLTRHALVHVDNDQVIDVTDLENGNPLSSPSFVTVTDLFEQLQDAIDRPAASIQVTFDATFGYPTEVYIDLDQMIADEEISYRAGSLIPLPSACDLSVDRTCGGPLIDALGDVIRSQSDDLRFDWNQDQKVDSADVSHLVEVRMKTYFGDANLDGQFNSSDFLRTFQAGQYGDVLSLNSTWTTGDWNGDREFDNSDLILALQRGGYQREPRSASMVAVPEPRLYGTAFVWSLLSILRWRPRNAHGAQRCLGFL